jgi:hypothetical protein
LFKPLTLSAQTTYVSHKDPAIDWDKIVEQEVAASPDLQSAELSAAEREERAGGKFVTRFLAAAIKNPADAVAMLRFRDGEQPTKFMIGVIPPDELTRISDECKLGSDGALLEQAKWRAFLASTRDIQNFGAETVPKRKVGEVEYADPVWLKAKFTRGLRDVALGVGQVALIWNQLREDEIKN